MRVFASGYDLRDEPFEARATFRRGPRSAAPVAYLVDPPETDEVEDVEVQFENDALGEWQSIDDVETIDAAIRERVIEDLIEAGRDS